MPEHATFKFILPSSNRAPGCSAGPSVAVVYSRHFSPLKCKTAEEWGLLQKSDNLEVWSDLEVSGNVNVKVVSRSNVSVIYMIGGFGLLSVRLARFSVIVELHIGHQ